MNFEEVDISSHQNGLNENATASDADTISERGEPADADSDWEPYADELEDGDDLTSAPAMETLMTQSEEEMMSLTSDEEAGLFSADDIMNGNNLKIIAPRAPVKTELIDELIEHIKVEGDDEGLDMKVECVAGDAFSDEGEEIVLISDGDEDGDTEDEEPIRRLRSRKVKRKAAISTKVGRQENDRSTRNTPTNTSKARKRKQVSESPVEPNVRSTRGNRDKNSSKAAEVVEDLREEADTVKRRSKRRKVQGGKAEQEKEEREKKEKEEKQRKEKEEREKKRKGKEEREKKRKEEERSKKREKQNKK